MTMGQGGEVWERFGHNAIWIHDAARGTDAVYNWGMFDFGQPHFIRRFMTGDTHYWMAAFDLAGTLEVYRDADRPVWVQELSLTPAQRDSLRKFVEWNARPENMYYRYDYYRDNCSTRVRDAIDRVLGGQVRRATERAPTTTTYRWHTRRLLAADWPVYAGTNIGLGHPGDRPISQWEEMFLPVRMQERLRAVRVADGAGGVVPLVRSERQLLSAGRPPELARPPNRLPLFLGIGAGVGLLLALLGRAAASGSVAGRLAFGVAGWAWAALTGVLGTAMLAAWTLTRHVYTARNENLLQFNPLALALVVLLPVALVRWRSGGGGRAVRRLAYVVAATSVAGLLLKALPAFDQRNGEVIALALPAHLGLAWALWRATTRSGPAPAGRSTGESAARALRAQAARRALG